MVVEHMLCGGGGGLSGNIGGGSGHGDTGKPDDLPGHGMVGAADGNGGQTAGGPLRDGIPGRQHDGQRAGPEGFRQVVGFLGDGMAEQIHLLRTGNVQDQRIVLGTALRLKDFDNSGFVQAVGAQAVDGLRGNGHQFPPADQFRGGFWRSRILCGQQ